MSATAFDGIRDLRIVDGDGHVLEPLSGMLDHAAPRFRDRIWHVETDADGAEWCVFDGTRVSSNRMAMAGTAGMPAADLDRAMAGGMRISEVAQIGSDPATRLEVMARDAIHQTVVYPTFLLGIAATGDATFAAAQAAAYNEWVASFCAHAPDRLFAAGVVPQQDVGLTVAAVRQCAQLGLAAVFLRPNAPIEGTRLCDPMYDPVWRACEEAGLPVAFHPYLLADVPGVCRALGLASFSFSSDMEEVGRQVGLGNIYFSQAIANPFDSMLTLTYMISGGVLERFPALRCVFLEANGGWVVPWLERLDHHRAVFGWDVPHLRLTPSEYFRRQCWISFDADEEFLAATANSPRCGADRIIWASDFPHPDAKFPGVVEELAEATASLTESQRRRIAGENAAELYGLPAVTSQQTEVAAWMAR